MLTPADVHSGIRLARENADGIRIFVCVLTSLTSIRLFLYAKNIFSHGKKMLSLAHGGGNKVSQVSTIRKCVAEQTFFNANLGRFEVSTGLARSACSL